jgi:ABC-type bacteriocin/lantibiotic exporter with double-glycine peptidase domain
MAEGNPNFEKLFRLLANDRKDMGRVVVFATLHGAISLSFPLGIQALIGQIMGGRLSASWWLLVAGVLFAIVLAGVLYLMQLRIVELLQQRIFVRSSIEFAHRIPLLRSDVLRRDYLPDLINRFFDTLTVQKELPKLIVDGATAILQIFFGLLLLLLYDTWFVIVALVIIALVVLAIRVSLYRGLLTSYEESTHKHEVAQQLEEMARIGPALKAEGETARAHSRVDAAINLYLDARTRHFRILYGQHIWMVIVRFAFTALLLIAGGALVVERTVSIGEFVAVEIVFFIIMNNAEKIFRLLEGLYDVHAGVEKIASVVQLPLEKRPEGGAPGYEQAAWSMEWIPWKLRVNAGTKLGLVIGEGTDVQPFFEGLAMPLSEAGDGLKINDLPIHSWDQSRYSERMEDNLPYGGFISGSVMENLQRRGATREEVIHTLLRLGLLQEAFGPAGWETDIHPDFFRWHPDLAMQLHSVRALAGDASLRIMYDALAGIRPAERVKWLEEMLRASQTCTLVCITHRADVLEKMDQVAVVVGNELTYMGPWSGMPERIKTTEIC